MSFEKTPNEVGFRKTNEMNRLEFIFFMSQEKEIILEESDKETESKKLLIRKRSRGKNSIRSKGWCFVWNNPPDNAIEALDYMMKLPEIDKMVYQLERGKEGTLHYQGYFYCEGRKSFKQLKRQIPEVHWEVAKGDSKQNYDYCTKEDTRVDGPWFKGVFTRERERMDLKILGQFILKIENDVSDINLLDRFGNSYARNLRFIDRMMRSRVSLIAKERDGTKKVVYIIWGLQGTGKTWMVRNWCSKNELNLYIVCHGSGNSKSLWFDGYKGEEAVLFDDFYGWAQYSLILELCHEHPYRVQMKGSEIDWCPLVVFFTSNKHPSEWWKEIDTKAFKRRVYRTIHLTKVFDENDKEPTWKDEEQEPEKVINIENENEGNMKNILFDFNSEELKDWPNDFEDMGEVDEIHSNEELDFRKK